MLIVIALVVATAAAIAVFAVAILIDAPSMSEPS